MKIALTFLTLAVVLLLGSLMWGMKTYTDFAHARSEVARLQREVDDYRAAALQGISPVQHAGARVPVAATTPSAPAPQQPGISEEELEAKLEVMMAERMAAQNEQQENKVSDLEAELRAMELEASQQAEQLNELRTEAERFEPSSLTADQNRIASAPVLTKVTSYKPRFGFVVLAAGKNKNITPGAQFSLRRGHMIIGSIKVLDDIEDTECVADVLPGSVPAGVEIKPGDEVIEFLGS